MVDGHRCKLEMIRPDVGWSSNEPPTILSMEEA